MEHFEGLEYNDVYRRFCNYIASSNKQGDVYEQILMFGLNNIDFRHKDDCTVNALKYIAYWGKEDLKNFASEVCKKNPDLSRMYESFEKEAKKYQTVINSQTTTTIHRNNDGMFEFVYAPGGYVAAVDDDDNNPF